jgi:hypothetical protein
VPSPFGPFGRSTRLPVISRLASKRRQCVGPAVRPGLAITMDSSAEGAAHETCVLLECSDLFTASQLWVAGIG